MRLPTSDFVRRRVAGPAQSALRGGLEQLVRRNLRGVWTTGELPTAGCVWASNHHSWWDFFVAAAALRSVGRTEVGVLMQAGNIGRPELFRQVGVVGTDRLRSAVSMLNDGMVLVVFPEGELRAAGGLGPVRPGARWLAERSGADLRTVATRVSLRGQQAPEAYLRISRPVTLDTFESVLSQQLSTLDDQIAAAPPEDPVPGFIPRVTGVRSWNERFGALRSGG